MINRSTLSRILYYSTSMLPREDVATLRDQEQKLVKQARRNNEFMLITSMVLHDAGFFLHMLEGDRSELNKMMQKISTDSRHKDIRIVEWREISRRELMMSFELVERNLISQEALERHDIVGKIRSQRPKPIDLQHFFLDLQHTLLAKRGMAAFA